MLRMALKILLVAGAAYWVFSGNRSAELIAFYGAAILLIGYDMGFPQREKSLLDRPERKKSTTMAEKILDAFLILTLGSIGIYAVLNS